MKARRLPSLLIYLVKISLIGLVYYLVARLGENINFPSQRALLAWLPAWLAWGSLLVWGWQVAPGIFVGAFFASLGDLSGSTAQLAAVAIASLACLQACLGFWLYRHFVGMLPPETIRKILQSIGIVTLTALLGSLVASVGLYFAGFIHLDELRGSFLTRWLLEMIGMFVFSPFFMYIFLRLSKQEIKAPVLWFLGSLFIGLTLSASMVIRDDGVRQEKEQIRRDALEMTHILQGTLDTNIQYINTITSFYGSLPDVSRNAFFRFTEPYLTNSPETTALSWAPRVTDGERKAFEQSIRKQGPPDFQIYEKDGSGQNVPSSKRAEYYPVAYIEPSEANAVVSGYDYGSNPVRLQAILNARDSGKPAAISPIRLVQETGQETGMIIMVPVYRTGMPIGTVEERRANLHGMASGIFRLRTLLDGAFREINRHDIELYLFDISNPETPQFLVFYPSISGAQALSQTGPPALAELQTGLFSSTTLEVADREWLMVAHPGSADPNFTDEWLAFSVLVIGLGLVGSFYLYINSRQEAEKALVHSEAEFRDLSEHALIGVIRMKTDGNILYANPAVARTFGFSLPDELLHQNSFSFFSDKSEIENLKQIFQSTNQVINKEMQIVNAHGEERQLLYSATLRGDVISGNFVDITERNRSVKELRQLSSVIAQMADLVIITDVAGAIEYVNPAFENLTGFRLSAIAGKTPRILKSGLQAASFYDELWLTICRGEVFQGEFINRKNNGEIFYEIETIAPIFDANNTITHFVATGKDVTDRKRADLLQETVYRIAEAAQASESLGDLYPQIHRHISSVMDARNFYIALYDKATDMVQVVYSDDETDTWSPEPFSASQGLTEYVIRTGKSLLCDDRKAEELIAAGVYTPVGDHCQVWLGVPLIARGETMGVMAVQHYTDANAYTEREQRILEFVSSQVATTIDRKQVEDAVRLVEKRNSALIENAPDGIALIDLEGKFVYASPSVYRMFEFSSQDIIGLDSRRFIHPEDLRLVMKTVVSILRDPSLGVTIEYRYFAKDGDYLWVEGTFHNLYTEPAVNAMLINFRDINEKKQAAELFQKSQENLETAQAIAQLGSWELDINNGTGLWSKEMYILFQRDPSEGVPVLNDFLEMVHPQDRPYLLDSQQLAIETGEPVVYVYRAISSQKRWRYFEARIQSVKNEQAQIIHMSGTVMDITERRVIELANQERVKELTCLFSVSRLLENNGNSETIVCRQIVNYLIPAMQFPPLAVPLIELFGKQYTTNRYTPDLSHQISAEILLSGEPCGRLAVYYSADEPFIIPEEQQLLDNISRAFGLWLERHQSELALRTSNERFEQLADNIQEVFWMFDQVDQKIVYISPAFEIIWGRSCEKLYQNGREYTDGILAEDRSIMFTGMEKQAAGERIELEYRVQRPDGTIRWVWDRSFPIFDPSGNLVRTAGIATDVTELKRAQNELEALNRDLEKRVEERTTEVRQNEATYRALFENSNDGIFLMSPEGVELRANQKALDLLGYTAQEWQEISNDRLVVPDEKQDAGQRFDAVLRGEQVPLYERNFITKDGKEVPVEINLAAVRDANGKIFMLQSVVRDITERKKAEFALRESYARLSAANMELEKASRMKDEFLASMSHELRTPLTGILGLSEALQMQTQGELNEKQLKAMRNIEKSGRHLLDLINDILDLSKIEAGKLDLQIGPCLLTDVCHASLSLVKGMAQQKKQNIGFNMNAASIILRVDARRLKQILVNLLSNAIKFTPEGGKLGLDIQGSEDQKIVRISVWDQGIGIQAEELDKLFKPFVQLDSSLARQYAGTGLGLALVRRMAELQGGNVTVESTPGQGSRFTIELPWIAGTGQPEPEVEEDVFPVLRDVLIVEDNDLDAEQMVRYLGNMGIANLVHMTVGGALEKAAILRPSAILLDMILPDGSGLDLLARLKEDKRTSDIPVIITSVAERRADAIKLGAVGYLVKPFSRKDLQVELQKLAQFVTPSDPDTFLPNQEPELFPIKNGSRPQVLIADDDELVLETIREFLETAGFQVAGVSSGFELLELFPTLEPDIILMDIQMPGMDGLETTRRLRASGSSGGAAVPIIAVTALAMPGDRESCLQAGANEYISKPVSLGQLVILIKQILRQAKKG